MKKITIVLFTAFVSVSMFSQDATHINFDGINDFVRLDTNNYPVTATYTKEAMIRLNSVTGGMDVLSGDPSCQDALWVSGGKLAAGHNGAAVGGSWTYVQDTEILNSNVWYHIAVSYDAAATTMKLYKNGVLVSANTSVPAASYNTAGKLYVGCYGGFQTYFNGSIDEVRLWNRVLTQAEIQNNMSCELAGQNSGLVLYYKCNQGVNNANNTAVTSVQDSSGNNLNGTLINMTLTGTISNWASGSPIFTGSTCEPFLSIKNDTSDRFIIYPNPAGNTLLIVNIAYNTTVDCTIVDINGRVLSTLKINGGKNAIDISNIPAGIYFIQILAGETIIIKKFIKS